jgi:hypothetical protein
MSHTIRQTFARYLSEQLTRAENFRSYHGWMLDDKREQRANDIERMLREYVARTAPSGSGIDAGVKLLDNSTPHKLVFSCDFHHMNEGGYYDGWTRHCAVVTPTFSGISVRITGRDRNGIKDNLRETLRYWLAGEAEHPALIERA